MSRRLAVAAALLAGLALGGCGHLHMPYIRGDSPFHARAERDAGSDDRRVDPVQVAHPVAAGTRPPCKFGGERCPPWERAWPANHDIRASDRVTDAGEVIRADPGQR